VEVSEEEEEEDMVVEGEGERALLPLEEKRERREGVLKRERGMRRCSRERGVGERGVDGGEGDVVEGGERVGESERELGGKKRDKERIEEKARLFWPNSPLAREFRTPTVGESNSLTDKVSPSESPDLRKKRDPLRNTTDKENLLRQKRGDHQSC